jgi:hypothetical protein
LTIIGIEKGDRAGKLESPSLVTLVLKDSLNMMAQSNQVMNDWQGNSITQLKEKTFIASFEIPAGYVNATQMCKACGKQWGHYACGLDSVAVLLFQYH